MKNNNQKFEKEIEGIINAYEYLVKGIDKKARTNKTNRAYGGIIRTGKGKFVESITEEIALLGWKLLGGDPKRISFEKRPVRIPIKKAYIDKIKNPAVRKYISENIDKYHYLLRTDVCISIDSKFAIGVECKSYTENAMFKRILIDFLLRREIYPNLKCVLLQLESQLGGDYSYLKDVTFGSLPTHTLLSYFDIDLFIVTLLEGERKVDQPIHKTKYYKPLTKKSLLRTIRVFFELLKEYKD